MAEASHRPGLRVAVLGHARHGKSALVEALAEHARARLGFPAPQVVQRSGEGAAPNPRRGRALDDFRLDTAERIYSGLDVAAHRRLVRHAGVAASAVDACLLVVSAVDGVMAQTREHAVLARHLSPGAVAVFINRCDEVADVEQLDLAEMETRQALFDAGFDGDAAVVVRGAARPPAERRDDWEPALDALLHGLDQGLADVARDEAAPLWATVLHRWRRPGGAGPVVEVSVRQGSFGAGDRVQVSGRNGVQRGARVLQTRAFGLPAPSLSAGQIGTVQLQFDGVLRATARFPRMGDVLLHPGVEQAVNPLRVRLRLLDAAHGGRRTPVRSGHGAGVWLWGRFLTCRVRLPQGVGSMAPGAERDDVLLDLSAPTSAPAGTSFVLRGGSDEPFPRGQRGGRWGGCFATGEVLATELPR